MKSKLILLAFLALLTLMPRARAETPDFSSCKALRQESSYKKYDEFMYLFQGKDGWFFRTKQDLKSDFKISDDKLALFKRFAEALKSKGTELVIAFPPTRAMAASKFLPDNEPLLKEYDPAVASKNYADLIAAMNAGGVHIAGTPDVKTADGYFYKLDMHWTTAGAKEMAEAVAMKIKTLPVYASLKKTEFVTTQEKDGTNEGHYVEALTGICGIKLADEVAKQERTKPRDSGHDKGALFDDKGVPEVVLVGTSNSNRDDFDLNFSGSLKQALSTDVYNAAIAGGGIDDAVLAYLSSDMYRKSPAKMLIWEIPGYYNLNGEAMAKALTEALPNVYGECETALAESAPVSLGGGSATLIDGLDAKNLEAGKYYFALGFDKTVRKKFELTLDRGEKGPATVKFSENRSPDKKSFYFAPSASEVPALKSLAIKPSGEMKGMKVTAYICPLP